MAALVGLSYLGLAQYVIWLNDPVNAGAGYWPANGVTLAALLLLPVRRWGWVIGAVIVAEIGGGAVHGYPVAASAWWAAGNVAEPAVAALLLRRFGGDGRLVPLRALASFLLAGVVIGPFVGAAIGSVGTSTVFGAPHLDVFLKWWVGDGLGVLVVAPLLLSFGAPTIRDRSWLEMAGTVVAVVAITLLAFGDADPQWGGVLRYLILPALMWAGIRLGIRGAVVTGFLVAEIANVATALGSGPLSSTGVGGANAITELQVFLAAALTSAYLIAVLVRDTLEATRHYERQRSIADAFQVAALPEELPTVPGLSVAARYEAASIEDTVRVGGDWYDAFPLPDGSTAFVIGDVTGHDLSSAVVMAEVRNGLRSLLTELGEPDQALAAMDRQLAGHPELTLVTAIGAVYADGELCWANAGHLPLLFVPSDGPVQYLTPPSNLILGTGRGRYETHRTRLDPGDGVVAYTDGVIEHRTRTLDDGFARLAELLTGASIRDPQAVCDLLIQEGLTGLGRDDDACVMTIHRPSLDRTGSV